MTLCRAFSLLRLFAPQVRVSAPCSVLASKCEQPIIDENVLETSNPEILNEKTATELNTEAALRFMQTPRAQQNFKLFRKLEIEREREIRLENYRPSRQSCNGTPLGKRGSNINRNFDEEEHEGDEYEMERNSYNNNNNNYNNNRNTNYRNTGYSDNRNRNVRGFDNNNRGDRRMELDDFDMHFQKGTLF